ncbi:hypothetical protein B0H13DRAFT_1888849 [Mycena leptocephala]|nr:hypothetical protein B0H13DRAFT_1888849 [Mycena leptocephala]
MYVGFGFGDKRTSVLSKTGEGRDESWGDAWKDGVLLDSDRRRTFWSLPDMPKESKFDIAPTPTQPPTPPRWKRKTKLIWAGLCTMQIEVTWTFGCRPVPVYKDVRTYWATKVEILSFIDVDIVLTLSNPFVLVTENPSPVGAGPVCEHTYVGGAPLILWRLGPAGTEPDIRTDIRTDTDTDTDSPTFKEWVDARLCREPNRICTASARGPVLSIMIILFKLSKGIGVKTQRHDPSEKGTALIETEGRDKAFVVGGDLASRISDSERVEWPDFEGQTLMMTPSRKADQIHNDGKGGTAWGTMNRREAREG